jgi:glycosyltransferase involved in cell wall biosynthesis
MTRLHKAAIALQDRLRPYKGHIDGVLGNSLIGWAQSQKDKNAHVRIGVFIGGALISETTANMFRGDLQAAGIGAGDHGFDIPLTPEILRVAEASGGAVEVQILDHGRKFPLGRCVVIAGSTPLIAETTAASIPTTLTGLQSRLYKDLLWLSDLMDETAEPISKPRPSTPHQAKLFGQGDYLNPERDLPKEMFAYTDFTRYRLRFDEKYDTNGSKEDIAHFYKRYLIGYCAMRGGLRTPLSAEAIAYLNEPVIIPGKMYWLTRAAWGFMMDVPPILKSINFDAPDWYDWAVYWWSVNQAEALHCEDCLVPQEFIDRLRRIPDNRDEDEAYPLSEFMVRFHAEMPELATLPIATEAGRRDLTCALMVLAISRPDYLRYIPQSGLDMALSDDGARRMPFARFCAEQGRHLGALDRAAYARALRHRSFDLDNMQFLTFTAEGHRAEYARLPEIPAGDGTVDVQVIGPFKKASGLGQATRLSADMIEAAGFAVNRVDFGLDNPAPEGFSSASEVSKFKPAKVNLIHLNSESVPLVAAYAPDYASNGYNIGYFYWELNTPAACHYLGMDLLDEIWVSTDYGVSIYQPHTNKPVTNVGMSFEELPEISRKDARAFVEKTAGLSATNFVFMVTFDSFSFVQRKNPLGVLAAFQSAFKDQKDVRLVIKTQNRTRVADPHQLEIWDAVDKILAEDSRIILIDETLKYEDLLRLKKGADAYISLHKSEGWGFGMIEAMNLGVPVICTAYSGNMDFCTPDTCWLVDYDITELEENDYIFVRPGQVWAEPKIEDAARAMQEAYSNTPLRVAKAEAARAYVQENFSETAIGQRYKARLDCILGQNVPPHALNFIEAERNPS